MERMQLSKPRVIFVKYDLFPQVRAYAIDSYDEKGSPCSGGTCWKTSAVICNMDANEAKPYVESLNKAISDQRDQHRKINKAIREELYRKCCFLKPS